MKCQYAFGQVPPGTFWQHGFVNPLAVLRNNRVQVVAQYLIKSTVMNNEIGFQIQRQTERVKIAGADGSSVIVHQCHFAMQRLAMIFVDVDAPFDQIVIQQPGTHFHNGYIRLALNDEFYPYAASRRFT